MSALCLADMRLYRNRAYGQMLLVDVGLGLLMEFLNAEQPTFRNCTTGPRIVCGDGRLHLTSQWSLLGNTANGNYSGSLTKSGGTLTGTQTWTGPGGGTPVVRTCTAALVPTLQ